MAVKKYLDLVGLKNYHVGILQNFTSDVTYGNTYTLLSTEPADWSTNYANYYTKSGDDYVPVSGSTAPTFAVDTYYSAVKELQLNKYPEASIVDGAVVKGNPSNTTLFSIEDLKTDLGLGNAAYQNVTSTYDSNDTVAPISGAGVAQAIQGITEPMIFKGGVTASTSGNTTTLTLGDASLGDIKKGYTFKFTQNGGTETETGKTFKAGDVLIATADIEHTAGATIEYDSSKWTYVPAGDDVDVTEVTAGTGLQIGDGTGEQSITSTGTINLKPATDSVIGGVKVAAVGTSNITLGNDGTISVATATAGTDADGTKGIVTTASNSSALSITSGSIAVKLKTETDNDTTLGIDSGGLYVNTITYEGAGNDISALFANS